MPALDERLYGNTLLTWLVAAAVAVISALALYAVKRVLLHRVEARLGRQGPGRLAIAVFRRTRFPFLFFLGLYAGAQWLSLPDLDGKVLRVVFVFGLVIQVAMWGDGLISSWLEPHRADRAAGMTPLGALTFAGKIVFYSFVLLFGLSNLGVDVSSMVAGLGIGGIAVALALQTFLSDVLASVAIMLDKPFVVGDFIVVDDYQGTVEHIGVKTTRVRSVDGEQLVFANSDLTQARLHNYKRMDERRVQFTLGLSYQIPPEALATITALVRDVVDAQECARFERAYFKHYGESALQFEIVYHVLGQDYALYKDVQHAVNLALYQRLKDAGIALAAAGG
ncbi:MAG: mechanosensitive ion channel family protein [Chloroflexi bacterium]|nr:mechanosensitive ion channel family protein [Chloroflexota bacterium]